jgi:hypothetical protein
VDETLTGAPPVDDDCLNSCQVTAVGAGQATYLGQFTRLSCVVVHEDGSPEGTTEFIAANGDTLCAEVKGEPPIVGPTGLTVRGTYTFIGGTGRFSDASGGVYFVGVITFDNSGTHIAVDWGSYSTEGGRGKGVSGPTTVASRLLRLCGIGAPESPGAAWYRAPKLPGEASVRCACGSSGAAVCRAGGVMAGDGAQGSGRGRGGR